MTRPAIRVPAIEMIAIMAYPISLLSLQDRQYLDHRLLDAIKFPRETTQQPTQKHERDYARESETNKLVKLYAFHVMSFQTHK